MLCADSSAFLTVSFIASLMGFIGMEMVKFKDAEKVIIKYPSKTLQLLAAVRQQVANADTAFKIDSAHSPRLLGSRLRTNSLWSPTCRML